MKYLTEQQQVVGMKKREIIQLMNQTANLDEMLQKMGNTEWKQDTDCIKKLAMIYSPKRSMKKYEDQESLLVESVRALNDKKFVKKLNKPVLKPLQL
jgi:superfamily II RNA helicase